MVNNFAKVTLVAAVAALVSFAAPAQASVVGITSLTGTDTFDWGQLGAQYTSLTGSQTVTSTLGNTGTVSSAGNSFQLRTQSSSWYGNFAPGAKLLWDNQVGPDITFSLNKPVGAIGAQIQPDFYGAFTAQVTAYNTLNQVLGSFSENGNGNGNADNSAIFIGMKDNINDIAKIQFVVTSASFNNNDFAIGAIQTANVSSVPLPAGLPMFVFALLAGFGAVQFNKQRKFA